MSLAANDRAWIRDRMRSEVAASEERTYRRIKYGALSELLDGLVAPCRGRGWH